MSQECIRDPSTRASLQKLKEKFEGSVHFLTTKADQLSANQCHESAAHHNGMAYAYMMAAELIGKALNELEP